MSDPEQSIDRRKFLTKSAALLAGGAAFSSTALSYDRILGANDRISLCHIGNGSRGGDLELIVSQLKTSQNVEINTVCDLWRLNREKAVAVNTKYYGRAPRVVSVFGGRAGFERHRRRDYFHARALPLTHPENGGRSR